MRYRDGLHALHGGTPSAASGWRWFPHAVCAAMAAVIAMNAGMVYLAMHTFPGPAGGDGFDLSNRYNQVLNRVQREAALGWTMQAEMDAANRPVLMLRDRAGTPLTGAALRATAERPLGPPHMMALAFHEASPGRYVADAPVDLPGQWDLLLSATAKGHAVATTRRILAR